MLNISNRRRSKKPNCTTPEMERLHPDCVLNTDPEKEMKRESRRRKIYDFFQEYRSQVGSPNLDINPTYQNRYVNFVRSLKDPRKTDEKWIYDHFVCDKWNPECVPEYVEDEDKQRKTQIQRQRLRFRASVGGGVKEQIENAYIDPAKNEPFITNIQKIFSREEGIGLEDKIEFIFDFSLVKRKLRYIQRVLYNIPIDVFINEPLQNDFLKGDMMMDELFIKHIGPDLHKFLVNVKILNKGILDEYNLQYTHKHRQAAFYTLSEIYNNYCDRIHLIYFICLRNLTKFTNKQMIMKMMNQKMILKPLEKYLFYINYGLIHFFEYKEEILATSFEDFYYLHLKQNILFIISLFECTDNYFKTLSKNPFNKGGQGDLYDMRDGTVLKITQKNLSYEKSFFEFFKQCCLYKQFPEFIVSSYKIIFGKKSSGIIMEKINGQNYLSYYLDIILNNKDENKQNIEKLKYEETMGLFVLKDEKFKEEEGFLKKISKIIKRCQEKKFVHRDLNFRNIMIDKNKKLYLIDFDFSIISIHNIYILNYRNYLNFDNIFNIQNKYIDLTLFAKSIDLFRIMIHYFVIYYYSSIHQKPKETENIKFFNKNPYLFETNSGLLRMFEKIFYGTSNPKIKFYLENKSNIQNKSYIIKKYGLSGFSYSNIYKIRKYIFEEFLKEPIYWGDKIRTPLYKNWIEPFIPEEFLKLLETIPPILPYIPPPLGAFKVSNPSVNPHFTEMPPQPPRWRQGFYPRKYYNPKEEPKSSQRAIKGGKKKTTKKKATKRKS